MKKILSLLMIALTVSFTVSASPALSLVEGGSEGLMLYAPDGTLLDSASDVGESGMVIRTGDTASTFASDYGDIYLKENSLLAVTGFDIADPSIYLVYGGMNVVMKSDLQMTVFTPSSSVLLPGEGEYVFTSTDTEESLLNLSAQTLTAYDGIRGINETVESMESVDYMAWPRNVEPVSEEEYYASSVIDDESLFVPEAPEAEAITETEPEEEPEIVNIAPPAPDLAPEPVIATEPPIPVVVDMTRRPEAPAIKEPGYDIRPEAEIIDVEKPRVPETPNAEAVTETAEEPETVEIIPPAIPAGAEINAETEVAPETETVTVIPHEVPDTATVNAETEIITQPETVTVIPPAVPAGAEIKTETEVAPEIETVTVTPHAVPDAAAVNSATEVIPDTVIIDVLPPNVPSAPVATATSETTVTVVSAAVPSSPSLSADTEVTPSAVVVDIIPAEAEIATASAIGEDDDVITEESEEAETAVTAAAEAEEEEKSDISFDLRLAARAYGSQNNGSAMGIALQPSLKAGAFTLTLNADPFAILNGIKSETVTEWIGFGTDFIEEISYYDDAITLAIDRVSYLPGDASGLFFGLDHGYDGKYSALSLNHTFSSEYYSHRIWFSDLSFRTEEGLATGGLELTASIGDIYPASITLGSAVRLQPENIKTTELYPEAAVYFPILWNGAVDLGFRASAATAVKADDFSANPFTENGMLITATVPVSWNGLNFEAGAAYSTGSLHYSLYGTAFESAGTAANGYLSIIASASYENEFFGARAEGWIDLDLDTMKPDWNNSYVDAAAYVNLWGLRLFGGFRTQFDFTDASIQDSAEYYGGIGTDLGPLYSRMAMSYNAEDGFALTFASSVSTFGRDKEEAEDFDTAFPISADIITGFESIVTETGDSMPVFLVMPRVTFGTDEYNISLRAPLKMTYDNGEFLLAGFNGHEKWNFGADEIDENARIYRIVTDSLAVIDSITVGNEESVGYILADRDYKKNGTLYDDFGRRGDLAMRLGLNLDNFALSLYADDAEAPHYAEMSLAFGNVNGPKFRLTLPAEILIEDTFTEYALLMYPEVRLEFPFLDRAFEISLYGIGEVSTAFSNGTMEMANIIFDFSTMTMYDYMAGLSFSMDLDTVAFTLEGGIRNGRLEPSMFNTVSAAREDVGADTMREIIAGDTGSNDIKYYAKATFALDLGFLDLRASYSVADILAFTTDAADFASLTIGGTINDSIRLYASFAKEDLVASFSEKTAFLDYISNGAVYSIGADFDFGRVGFSALLSERFAEREDSEWINAPAARRTSDPMLTIKARLSF